MNLKDYLKTEFEQLELNTVSASFGGKAILGKAPTFNFKPIMKYVGEQIEHADKDLKDDLSILKKIMNAAEFKYTLQCLGRFAFCIELTKLDIGSTKMKTRWVPGSIKKTEIKTFNNFDGPFKPGEDERSASFDECYAIFFKCTSLLAKSDKHQKLMTFFSKQKHSAVPYEAVFTYIKKISAPVHAPNNIRLVQIDDAEWLINARPIIRPMLNKALLDKVSTKSYQTDRSQTGVMTNRAKRWECLAADFQHATIEDCWSVERKLWTDLIHFEGFPDEARQKLFSSSLFTEQPITLCPITFKPMEFQGLLGGGDHGKSDYQVGHSMPLKAKGRHEGDNIEWISGNGNRIQGSLNITETRQMLNDIFSNMLEKGLITLPIPASKDLQ